MLQTGTIIELGRRPTQQEEEVNFLRLLLEREALEAQVDAMRKRRPTNDTPPAPTLEDCVG